MKTYALLFLLFAAAFSFPQPLVDHIEKERIEMEKLVSSEDASGMESSGEAVVTDKVMVKGAATIEDSGRFPRSDNNGASGFESSGIESFRGHIDDDDDDLVVEIPLNEEDEGLSHQNLSSAIESLGIELTEAQVDDLFVEIPLNEEDESSERLPRRVFRRSPSEVVSSGSESSGIESSGSEASGIESSGTGLVNPIKMHPQRFSRRSTENSEASGFGSSGIETSGVDPSATRLMMVDPDQFPMEPVPEEEEESGRSPRSIESSDSGASGAESSGIESSGESSGLLLQTFPAQEESERLRRSVDFSGQEFGSGDSGAMVEEQSTLWEMMETAMLFDRHRRSTDMLSSGMGASGVEFESSGIESSGLRAELMEELVQADLLDRFRRASDASLFSGAEASEFESSGIESSKVESSGEPVTSECRPVARCGSDDDCFGGTCIGAFVGKCRCLSCISFLSCSSDAHCGGLQGGCNATLGHCTCTEAIIEATQLSVPLLSFCNVKECSKNECLGLPCWEGFCACPNKKNE